MGGTESAAGATKNDARDPDEGPNGLQNKPVLTSATNSAGQTKFVSTDSEGNGSFTFTPSQRVPLEHKVTATATNSLEANTFEFSVRRAVTAP